MKRYLVFIFVAMTSCYNSSINDDSQQKDQIEDIRFILNNYSLPHRDSITDENSFIFFKEHRWDTSFVLMLHKDTSQVIGIYQEMTPRNTEIAYSTGVLFFDGCRFAIDFAAWEKVISESWSLLDTINYAPDTNCLDCATYILSHGSKSTISSGKKSRRSFEDYSSFLRRTLVYPALKKKKEFDEGLSQEKQ